MTDHLAQVIYEGLHRKLMDLTKIRGMLLATNYSWKINTVFKEWSVWSCLYSRWIVALLRQFQTSPGLSGNPSMYHSYTAYGLVVDMYVAISMDNSKIGEAEFGCYLVP